MFGSVKPQRRLCISGTARGIEPKPRKGAEDYDALFIPWSKALLNGFGPLYTPKENLKMNLPPSLTKALQSGITKRHNQGQHFQLGPPASEIGVIDFGSNDTLCLRTAASMRKNFLDELWKLPSFAIGAGGSRVLDGSNKEIMDLERLLADFHRAEEAMFFNSGYEANLALYTNLPQPGDAIMYDTMVHASIHDGMRFGRASIVKPFEHNDLQSLDNGLRDIKESSPDISSGAKTVFIAIESFYSMDGDIAPVREILLHMKAALPDGNGVVIVDEAHSTGIIGPNGSGYIRHLGLEKEPIISMQSYGKGPGALGGVLLCNSLIKEYLTNYARSIMYSTGPLFPTIASIRAAVRTLSSEEGEHRRQKLRNRVKLFHDILLHHPMRKGLSESGVLKFPSVENQKNDQSFVAIFPIVTAMGQCHKLQQRLRKHGFRTHALRYPTVAREEERVRFIMHADNKTEDIREFVRVMMAWGCENSGISAQPRARL
ncbi:hypothetical protein FE257_010775 [Aspergillus nanangensis]|uniref:Aminotransferase class I/classII large domain-containing protein n=1 Tax=Aspergillus nanangensis TaxID=2582783 RepID=A0AAD4CX82_ASPNN|nr:hypothetical protein FE257_010775 [Aspergillus nanangensis]